MSRPLSRRALLQGASAGAVALALVGGALLRRPAEAAMARPVIGSWGFDTEAMDRSIAPGDDFFRHAGGSWMKNNKIPDDRSRWGAFNILGAKSEDDVRAAIMDAARTKPARGSVARKVVDYFGAYNDVVTIHNTRLEQLPDAWIGQGMRLVPAEHYRIASVEREDPGIEWRRSA